MINYEWSMVNVVIVKVKRISLTERTEFTESLPFIDSFLCVLRVLCEKVLFLKNSELRERWRNYEQ